MASLRDGIVDWLKVFGPVFEAAGSYRSVGRLYRRASLGVSQKSGSAATARGVIDHSHNGRWGKWSLWRYVFAPSLRRTDWLAYLNKHASIANNLVGLIAQHDVLTSLRAQNDYLGPQTMNKIAFSPASVATALKRADFYDAAIRAIGKRLGWQMTRWNPLASIASLSRETGYEHQYRFLYQATSRFVHFSTQELFRRVWGQKGEVEIGSTSFAAFFGLNSQCIGAFGCLSTLSSSATMFSEKRTSQQKRLRGWISAAMPILTAEELEAWPEERS